MIGLRSSWSRNVNSSSFTVKSTPLKSLRNSEFSDHVALADTSGNSLTYRELNQRVELFIDYLKSKGATSGSRFAILQHKTFECVVAILASRSIGATYIPIDPSAPASRIRTIIQDCDPDVLICDPKLFPSDIPCQLEVCSCVQGMENTCVTFLSSSHPQNEEFAYILYTSGSTGVPKGVCVSESAASAFIQWSITTFDVKAGDNVSSIAPFHFDLSVFDLYVTLEQGATLHLFRAEEIQNVRALAEYIASRKINVIYSTPTFFSTLLLYGKAEKYDWSAIRTILFAGEVFPVKTLHQLMSLWNSARFYNLYGPTETNVCTYTEIFKDDSRTIPYPIGLPCRDHQIEITEQGELLVGGPHVANGYLHRPELTDSRFFVVGEKRWFRTGDHVEKDSNGNLIYKGRFDRMVKRRGYRIELGEIEVALTQHPAIPAAVIIPMTLPDGTLNLIAVVSTTTGKDLDLVEIKSFLIKLIPDYMLPDAVKTVDSFPKTGSGKADYLKLEQEIVSSLLK